MNLFNNQLVSSFQSKQVVKVISGLNNSSIYEIIKIVKAAELANASYIDIIANTNVVKFLKFNSRLPICVSSINPLDLYNCAIAGADLVEIGNFDSFYKKNIYLTPLQIIKLAQETRYLVNNINICVTIPSYLYLHQQIYLAQELEMIGINILQTEGQCKQQLAINNSSRVKCDTIFNAINLSSSSLSSTYALSKAVKIPIIASSSMNSLSSIVATSYGASGVGIGSSINQYQSLYEMSSYIKEIRQSFFAMQACCKYHSFSIKLKSFGKQKVIYSSFDH